MNRYVIMKLASVLISTISQVLLKKSANKQHANKWNEYFNFFVIFGYGLFVVSSILSVFSLRGMSISYSAIIESLSYVLIPIVSCIFLNEKMNKTQVVGIMLIVIGVVLYNL